MKVEFVAIQANQRSPVQLLWDDRGTAEWGFGLLVRHLEEEQECQLFDVVLVRKAVVAQDVAVVPQFLDDGRAVAHASTSGCFALRWRTRVGL